MDTIRKSSYRFFLKHPVGVAVFAIASIFGCVALATIINSNVRYDSMPPVDFWLIAFTPFLLLLFTGSVELQENPHKPTKGIHRVSLLGIPIREKVFVCDDYKINHKSKHKELVFMHKGESVYSIPFYLRTSIHSVIYQLNEELAPQLLIKPAE